MSKIKEIIAMDIKESDAIKVTVEKNTPYEIKNQISNNIKTLFPFNALMIMEEGMDLTILDDYELDVIKRNIEDIIHNRRSVRKK